MTPLYTLTIGEMTVFQGFGSFEDQIFAIFYESEKNITRIRYTPEEDDEFEEFAYRTTVRYLTERLDLMGFTEEDCKKEFSEGIADYVDELKRSVDSQKRFFESHPEYVDEKFKATTSAITALTNVTLCEWLDAFVVATEEAYLSEKEIEELPALHRHLLGLRQREGAYIPFSDLCRFVRACLCCARPEEEVVLDYTTAIYEEKCSRDSLLAVNANERLLESAQPGQKIILLTEGSTDALILSKSLKKLFPHVAELFSFLDHTTFSLGGGTANIISLLKGLASCTIANRVVAIFDNDAAGSAFHQKAATLMLPNNFRLVQLPDLDLARQYPSQGPTGRMMTDINGSACSIELYLGHAALRQNDGSVMPIQWTGIDRSLNRYQGELLNKKQAQEYFLNSLEVLENDSAEFDGVRLIFRTIFEALI